MNSMEEDIDILERFLKICDEDLFTEISIKTNGLTRNAIEHLIKSYKELEEENRIFALEGSRVRLKIHIDKNYIPVSLVEETIEELNKQEQKLQDSISDEEREEYSDANISYQLMDIEIKRSVLQELLEKRK
jgi:hypothetical protein